MNGVYRIPLARGETPESNKTAQKIIKMFDPGAEWTMRVYETPLRIDGVPGALNEIFSRTRTLSEAYVEIRATGGKPRKVRPLVPQYGTTCLKTGQIEKLLAAPRRGQFPASPDEVEYLNELLILARDRETPKSC